MMKKKHCGFVHLAKHVWFLRDSSFAFVQFHITKDYACEVKFSSHVKMKIFIICSFLRTSYCTFTSGLHDLNSHKGHDTVLYSEGRGGEGVVLILSIEMEDCMETPQNSQ